MNPANIYISEFGNTHANLSENDAYSHHIYTAVVFNQEAIEKAGIVSDFIFSSFGLRDTITWSDRSDSAFEKRLAVLSELVQRLDFTIDVLVIDKSRIDSEGLKQKQIFYKFFQSLFVSKYNDRFDAFFIRAAAVDDDFKTELEQYVKTKAIQRDLFHPDRNFQFTNDSKEDKLIQLTHFISDCTGKIFCVSQAHHQARDLYNLIHSRTSVDYFPFDTTNAFGSTDQTSEVDKQIRNINLQSIEKHLDKQASLSGNEQVLILNYLRLQSEINPDRLVPTHEILGYLQNYMPTYTTEKLRLLIRDLRYDGLFIVSQSGKPGYKLANCYEDIYEHFNHFLKYVIPMLQKVQILNQQISSHSFNKINPIEKDSKMIVLKELLSSLA